MKKLKIGFVGSMNAMPMGYALRFKNDGHDVRYIVEAAPDNYLMRPEHQYHEAIQYPYPDWVVEMPVKDSVPGHVFPAITYRAACQLMADRNVVFLNDYGIALAGQMPSDATLVALCSGADLDVVCNYQAAWTNARAYPHRLVAPAVLAFSLVRAFNQRRGLKKCDVISYFPKGLNPVGDSIIDCVVRRNRTAKIVRRYDVNFAATGATFKPIVERRLTKILVPVRFNISPYRGTALDIEYKGNDLIIGALAKYRRRNPSIEVKFFLKGHAEDIHAARKMCKDLGLSGNVEWLAPVPLPSLMEYFYDCDVCIDQVGTHWMGAIGALGLYCGRPVIANARPDVFSKLWVAPNPILQATTADEIYEHLVKCEDIAYRSTTGLRGHLFAKENLDIDVFYRRFVDALNVSGRGARA